MYTVGWRLRRCTLTRLYRENKDPGFRVSGLQQRSWSLNGGVSFPDAASGNEHVFNHSEKYAGESCLCERVPPAQWNAHTALPRAPKHMRARGLQVNPSPAEKGRMIMNHLFINWLHQVSRVRWKGRKWHGEPWVHKGTPMALAQAASLCEHLPSPHNETAANGHYHRTEWKKSVPSRTF